MPGGWRFLGWVRGACLAVAAHVPCCTAGPGRDELSAECRGGAGAAGRAPQQPAGMYTNSEFIGSMPAIELDEGDGGVTGEVQPGALHATSAIAAPSKVRAIKLGQRGARGSWTTQESDIKTH